MAEKNKENFGELYGKGIKETAKHPEKLREVQEISELERREGEKEDGTERKEGEELETEREKVTEAFKEKEKPSLEEYIDQNASKALAKKEKELEEEIERKRTLGGEKLPPEEVQRLTRDFYLKELGYSVQYGSQRGNWLNRKIKDLFWSRATVLDKEGKPILDKEGKAVEFKTAWTPKGETPLISFLKQEFLEKTKKELRKEQGEKETIKRVEEAKPKKEEEKKEAKQKKKEREGIDFKKMETEGVFEKMREMNIEKNAGDIIESVKEYGPGVSLPRYIEKLLKQYDQQEPEQFRFEKMKENPKSLREWLAGFLTDIRYPERIKKLREIKLEVAKEEATKKEATKENVEEKPKDKKPKEAKEKIEETKEAHPVESILANEQLEKKARDLIEDLDKRENAIPFISPPVLINLLRVRGLDKEEVDLMKPEEVIARARELLGIGTKEEAKPTMPSKSKTLSEEAELFEEEFNEEESERRPKNKKESAKEDFDWLLNTRKLMKNGSFKVEVTDKLWKFLEERGWSNSKIKKMEKDPKAAWEEAFKIYDNEQKKSKGK